MMTSCLRHRQVAAGGDADLLQHEVDIGDHLGDGMLDLDPGIHLDEIEFAVLVEEFDGADAEILHLLHRLGDGGADPGARRGIERRRGAFFPDFLMAALQRAIAFAEMDRAAAAVAEHLDFDVARLLQVFLEIDRRIAERRFGFVGSGRERQHQVVGGLRDLHAASAAARGRLDQHRKANRLCDRHRVVVGTDGAIGAGHHGNAELPGGFLGLDLVAHQPDVFGFRPDEMQIVIGEDFRKAGVLRKKAVAGVHRVGAGDLAGGQQRWHIEIAVLGRRRADADALVGEAHMHGVGVGGGMHRDGSDAEFLARAQNTQCDFAAIGYQDLVEHGVLGGE